MSAVYAIGARPAVSPSTVPCGAKQRCAHEMLEQMDQSKSLQVYTGCMQYTVQTLKDSPHHLQPRSDKLGKVPSRRYFISLRLPRDAIGRFIGIEHT